MDCISFVVRQRREEVTSSGFMALDLSLNRISPVALPCRLSLLHGVKEEDNAISEAETAPLSPVPAPSSASPAPLTSDGTVLRRRSPRLLQKRKLEDACTPGRTRSARPPLGGPVEIVECELESNNPLGEIWKNNDVPYCTALCCLLMKASSSFAGWKKTKAKVNHFDFGNSFGQCQILRSSIPERVICTLQSNICNWIRPGSRLSDFGSDLMDPLMSWIGFGSTTTGLMYKPDRLGLSTRTRFRFILRGLLLLLLLLLPFSAAASHLFPSAAPIACDPESWFASSSLSASPFPS
ncbi:hypothetical protein GW17_00001182 [Ensete ventricosum]|nr:hypothetical protein GW17_00001182 [Ensete ventricosum]